MSSAIQQCTATAAVVSVETRALRAVLTDAGKVTETRRPLSPALRGVLLHTCGDALLVTGSDDKTWITSRVAYAGDAIPTVLVAGKLLAKTVESHDPSGQTTLTVDDQHLVVGQGNRTTRLVRMPAEDYPTPPLPPPPAFETTGNQLTRVVDRVTPAASTDETTVMLTCVRVEVGDGLLSALATDRHRLSVQSERVVDHLGGETAEVAVPARSLRLLAKLLAHAEDVTVGVDDDHLFAGTPDRRFAVKLATEGRFPRLHTPIPAPTFTVTVDRLARSYVG